MIQSLIQKYGADAKAHDDIIKIAMKKADSSGITNTYYDNACDASHVYMLGENDYTIPYGEALDDLPESNLNAKQQNEKQQLNAGEQWVTTMIKKYQANNVNTEDMMIAFDSDNAYYHPEILTYGDIYDIVADPER